MEEIEVSGEEPRGRVSKGFEELVSRIYPNLRMLQGIAYKEEDIPRCLQSSSEATLLADEPSTFSEAEEELLSFIKGKNKEGIRTTLKGVVDEFGKRPYGWYLAAIQCNLAKLCGRGKVDVRSDATLLEGEDLVKAIRNTHGFSNVVLEPQEDFTASQIRNLQIFYKDFFDRPARSSEARALGKETGEAFKAMENELKQLAAQSAQFPFLSVLEEISIELGEVGAKPYDYHLNDLPDREGEFLEQKEEILDPVRRFMGGQNRDTYTNAREFLASQDPNFTVIESELPDELREILDDPECYKGNQMIRAREIVGELDEEIQALLEKEKTTRKRDVR